MSDVRSAGAALPLVGRWTAFGAGVAGALGALVGLVVGLRAYPPTAAFAVLEVGVPGAVIGAVVGAVAASVVLLVLCGRARLRPRRPAR
jgi:hypothetical protein